MTSDFERNQTELDHKNQEETRSKAGSGTDVYRNNGDFGSEKYDFCERCNAETEPIDCEWIGPGQRLYLMLCPECNNESVISKSAWFVGREKNSYTEQLVRLFQETKMSEKALQRSINRAFGLPIRIPHEQFDSYHHEKTEE